MKEIEALPSVKAAGATVKVLDYARATHTGLVYPTDKYYPTWSIEEDHAAVRAGVDAAAGALGRKPDVGKSVSRRTGSPRADCLGSQASASAPRTRSTRTRRTSQCPVNHLARAAAFYALFGAAYLEASRTEKPR